MQIMTLNDFWRDVQFIFRLMTYTLEKFDIFTEFDKKEIIGIEFAAKRSFRSSDPGPVIPVRWSPETKF